MAKRSGWILLILWSVLAFASHGALGQEPGEDRLARRPGDVCPDPFDPRVSVYLPAGDTEACSRLCCAEGEELFRGPGCCGCIWTRSCPRGSTPVRVGGLHYPFERYGDCAVVEREAEGRLQSYHYREACQAALGGQRPDAVLGASMTSCVLTSPGSFVTNVEVCCPEPEPCEPWEPAGPDRLYCLDRTFDAPPLGEHGRPGCSYRWSPGGALDGSAEGPQVGPAFPMRANPTTFLLDVECDDGCRYQDSATYRTGPVAGIIRAPSGPYGAVVPCGGSTSLTLEGWIGEGVRWECAPSKDGPWGGCPGQVDGSSVLLGPLQEAVWVRAETLCGDAEAVSNTVAVDPLCIDDRPDDPIDTVFDPPVGISPTPKPKPRVKKRLEEIRADGTVIFEIVVANDGSADIPGLIDVVDRMEAAAGDFKILDVSTSSPGWSCTDNPTQASSCLGKQGVPAGYEATFEASVRMDRSDWRSQTNCAVLRDFTGDFTHWTRPLAESCVDLPCPAYGDPTAHYVRDDEGRVDYETCGGLDASYCGPGQAWFWGLCGCGCIDEPLCWTEGPGESVDDDSPVWRVARRAGDDGASHLLLTVDSGTGDPVEEVRVELPKRTARDASPAHLPSGWSMERDGGTLLFAGPATGPPVHLKLDVGGRKVPDKVDFELRTAGGADERLRNEPVAELPPLETANNLQGIVILPETVSPGDTIQIRPLDPARTPPEGRWTIGGEVLEPLQAEVQCADDGAAEAMLELQVPFDWVPGRALEVVYEDPWGETVVELPDAGTEVGEFEFEDLNGDGVWNPGEPRSSGGAAPAIEDGSEVVVAGGEACACGVFPDLEARTGLLLDGRRLGPPVTASASTVWIELPDDVALGRHRVSGWAGAAFAAGSGFDLDVVRVEGHLDAAQLVRGGSTTMRLQVVGTERPVALRVRNRTPAVISLEGGDDQTLTTSGGTENTVTRTVRATGPGAFDLQWELPSCPCDDG